MTLFNYSATDLQEMIHNKELSIADLTAEAYTRIESFRRRRKSIFSTK